MLTREEYIKRHASDALHATFFTPIFPSVAMAQAILESNNGNSTLTAMYKNHHGMKVSSTWKGESVNMNTKEVYSGNTVTIADNFKVYKTDYESFKDHAELFARVKSYDTAGVNIAKTPEEQIAAIKKGGYATDPDYVGKIISIIDSNNLRKLDQKKKFCNWLLQSADLSCF